MGREIPDEPVETTLTMPDDGKANLGDVIEVKGPMTTELGVNCGVFLFHGTVSGRCEGKLILTGTIKQV